MFTPTDLLEYIEAIYEWNRIAWNKDSFNKHLEISMLSTEYAEWVQAIESWDIKEQQDALADILFAFVWTQYKQWISAMDTYLTFIRVLDSNFSKFTHDENSNPVALKDEWGKIIKPAWYFKPDLSHLDEYIKN